MAQQTITLSEDFEAPVERVFEEFADHARFAAALTGPLGTRLKLVRRIRIGDDLNAANGVGSVRRIAYGPLAFEETITVCEPPRLIEYRISRGSPLRDHHGRIEFNRLSKDGTHVDYTIVFAPKIPGTGPALAKLLRGLIESGFKRMHRQLER